MDDEHDLELRNPDGWRRTDAQLIRDAQDSLDLQMQGYSVPEIAELVTQRRDYIVSVRMAEADLTRAKKLMKADFRERIETLMSEELRRLDIAERLAWTAFRNLDETGTFTEEVVQELRDGDEEVRETMRRRVTSWGKPVVLGWFGKILEIQRERRKILHMYAPSSVTLISTQTGSENVKQVKVKAIMGFNPDQEWPEPHDAIEGEIVD